MILRWMGSCKCCPIVRSIRRNMCKSLILACILRARKPGRRLSSGSRLSLGGTCRRVAFHCHTDVPLIPFQVARAGLEPEKPRQDLPLLPPCVELQKMSAKRESTQVVRRQFAQHQNDTVHIDTTALERPTDQGRIQQCTNSDTQQPQPCHPQGTAMALLGVHQKSATSRHPMAAYALLLTWRAQTTETPGKLLLSLPPPILRTRSARTHRRKHCTQRQLSALHTAHQAPPCAARNCSRNSPLRFS